MSHSLPLVLPEPLAKRADASSIKQIYHGVRLCLRLKQTGIYLVAYFFLGDCLNTLGG